MLHRASALGHTDALKCLIEHTGCKPDMLNSSLATPLHHACREGHEDTAKFLIGCGVDVNMQDDMGQTCLLLCCIHRHTNLAQILIESSIAGHTPEPLDINQKDLRGLTAMNCAAIIGDLDLIKILYEKGGADLEVESPKGCTPLLFAARGTNVDLIKYLLEKKVNTLKQDNSGGTVAHHAVDKGQLQIINALIEYSVDLDIPNNYG